MQLAHRKAREVRESLMRRRVFMFPQESQRPGQVPVWEAHFEGPYAVGVLAGDWQLHGRWRYWSDPGSGEALLQESSVGVTVMEHDEPSLPEPVCIARYDVELHGSHRGRHVNVFQPLIEDKVHWIFPDTASMFDDWTFDLVLEFLLEDLPNELLSAGWPPA